jgi:hypothetical protein
VEKDYFPLLSRFEINAALLVDLVIVAARRFYAMINTREGEKEFNFHMDGWTSLRKDPYQG